MDACDAVEAEAFAILNVPAVTGLGFSVFQHVPEDTQPPVLIISDMSGEMIGGKGDIDEKIDLTLVAVYRGEERRPLRNLRAQVIALLDQHTVSRDGWTIQFTFGSSEGQLLEDGETYVENFRLSILALKN